jgi:hypothetical protein
MENLINKRVVFCMLCGECLGEDRKYCAEEHIKNHPSHNDFIAMWIVDPLLLPNLDEWLQVRLERMSRQLTGRNSDNKLTGPSPEALNTCTLKYGIDR